MPATLPEGSEKAGTSYTDHSKTLPRSALASSPVLVARASRKGMTVSKEGKEVNITM